VMPQRKVEVFPKESRGLPKGKSRSSQRKVEVFPKASTFGGRRTWKRYLRRSCPPLGAVFGSSESSFRWGNSGRPAFGSGHVGIPEESRFPGRRTAGRTHGGHADMGGSEIIITKPPAPYIRG
jgi:hypothetical protein